MSLRESVNTRTPAFLCVVHVSNRKLLRLTNIGVLLHAASTRPRSEKSEGTASKETQCDKNTFEEVSDFLYQEGHFDDDPRPHSVIFATRGGSAVF